MALSRLEYYRRLLQKGALDEDILIELVHDILSSKGPQILLGDHGEVEFRMDEDDIVIRFKAIDYSGGSSQEITVKLDTAYLYIPDFVEEFLKEE